MLHISKHVLAESKSKYGKGPVIAKEEFKLGLVVLLRKNVDRDWWFSLLRLLYIHICIYVSMYIKAHP